MDEVADLSYYRPDAFRIDVDALPDAQKARMAGNREALRAYGGTAMSDPAYSSGYPTSRSRRSWSGGPRTGSCRRSMPRRTRRVSPARVST
jgi:hypothetical protein